MDYDFDFNDHVLLDPYDAMPFGDAIRFEENQLALEHEYDEESDDDYNDNFEDISE